jgi:hypothetical protein
MNDAAKMVLDYLLSQEAVTLLVGNRLWAEALTPPKEAYKPSHSGALAFSTSTGSVEAADRLLRIRWQFKSYGPTIYVIRDVNAALCDVLLLPDVKRFGIESVIIEAFGAMLEEPDTAWDFKLTFIETRIKSGLPIPV